MPKHLASTEYELGKPGNAANFGSQKLDGPCDFFGGHNPGEKTQSVF